MLKLSDMPIVDLVLPKLGESIMEATILKWHKKVGDAVQLDETLLDIATDKVDSEIPSTSEGILTEILFEAGSVVPIGTVIAKINSKTELNLPINEIIPPIENLTSPIEEVPFVPSAPVETTKIKSKTLEEKTEPTTAKFFSPLVLNIAQNEGVSMEELQYLKGTGSNGRITKKDIIDFIARKKMGINPSHNIENVPNRIERPILNKPVDVYVNTTANFSATASTK